MYQVVQSAKLVKCDETGKVGVLIGDQVFPVGGVSDTEEWTFTLEDGSTVTKKVMVVSE